MPTPAAITNWKPTNCPMGVVGRNNVRSPIPIMDKTQPMRLMGRYFWVTLVVTPHSIANGEMTKATGSVYTLDRIGDAPLQAWKYAGM